MDGPQAVGPGVASADDDRALSRGGDELVVGDGVPRGSLVLEGEVFHGKMDPLQLAARDGQVAGLRGPARQNHGAEFLPQLFDGNVGPNVAVGPENDAALFHEAEPPVQDPLLQLEFGDAVAQQPANPVGPLKDRHRMACPVQLLRRRQARGAGADHGHLLSRADGGREGFDPAFIEGPLDDGNLNLLDGHGIVIDSQHAGALARSRTKPPGKLGEIVGGVQAADGLAPAVAVNQVVPVRDEVAERASLMAEGNAAVHAAGSLLLQLRFLERKVNLLPVVDSLLGGPALKRLPLKFHKTGHLTHALPPSPLPPRGFPAPGLSSWRPRRVYSLAA